MYNGLRKTIDDCGLDIVYRPMPSEVGGCIQNTRDEGELFPKTTLIVNSEHGEQRTQYMLGFLFSVFLLMPRTTDEYSYKFSKSFKPYQRKDRDHVSDDICSQAKNRTATLIAPKYVMVKLLYDNYGVKEICDYFKISEKHYQYLLKTYGIENITDRVDELDDSEKIYIGTSCFPNQ